MRLSCHQLPSWMGSLSDAPHSFDGLACTQVQQAWEEAFPFADKKALKAARLVGLKEHPQVIGL